MPFGHFSGDNINSLFIEIHPTNDHFKNSEISGSLLIFLFTKSTQKRMDRSDEKKAEICAGRNPVFIYQNLWFTTIFCPDDYIIQNSYCFRLQYVVYCIKTIKLEEAV